MRTDSLAPELAYIENTFAREDEVLQQVAAKLVEDGKNGMRVRPHEGKILQFFSRMIGAKRVVEVGTLYGYSTIWLARSIEGQGKVYALESSEENAAIARENFKKAGLENKIELMLGDAVETLSEIEGPVDMVFIDANKGAYAKYLDWAEKNVRKGGLIIGDNTFLFGHVYKEEKPDAVSNAQWTAMREFNQRLADSKEFESMMIPTAEGMTVAVKL